MHDRRLRRHTRSQSVHDAASYDVIETSKAHTNVILGGTFYHFIFNYQLLLAAVSEIMNGFIMIFSERRFFIEYYVITS